MCHPADGHCGSCCPAGLWFALVHRSWCGVWVSFGGARRTRGGRVGRLPWACWFHGRVGGGKVLFVLKGLSFGIMSHPSTGQLFVMVRLIRVGAQRATSWPDSRPA